MLTVRFGQVTTDVVLERAEGQEQLTGIVPGAVVRLTGVFLARLDEAAKVASFQVVLRSKADVVVVSRPAWWTLRRVLWMAAAAASIDANPAERAALAGGSGTRRRVAWVMMPRRPSDPVKSPTRSKPVLFL